MFEKRAIIKCNALENRQVFEETLRLTIDAEYDIKYEDKYIYLEIYDFEDSFSKINTLYDLLNNDFYAAFSILIVPKFDDFMIKLLNTLDKPGIYNAYQVLNSLLIQNKIKKEDIPMYFKEIDKELLNTFIIYYEVGLNICLTSRLLYLHRNTLNYKLTKLSNDLDMDVRDNLIANFIYLLIKIIQ